MSRIVLLALVAASLQAENWTQLVYNGTPPPPLVGAAFVFDPATDRAILYGGAVPGGQNYSGTYVLANANGVSGTPTWSVLSTSGGPPTGKGYVAGVYDRTNNRLIVFGGFDTSSFFPTNETWVLSNANGLGGPAVWTKLTLAGPLPAVRLSTTAVYEPGSNRMTIFGGTQSPATSYNDVWVLTKANGLGGAPAWVQLSPAAPVPPVRSGHLATYDAATNRMTVFGGAGALKYSDTWILSNANGLGGTPVWSQLSAGSPPNQITSAYVYDPVSNTIVLQGGVSQGLYTSDTWRLTSANGNPGSLWSVVTVTGTPPSPREGAMAVFDPISGKMLVFGGTGAQLYNDLYVLSPLKKVSTQLSVTVSGYTLGRDRGSPYSTAVLTITNTSMPPDRGERCGNRCWPKTTGAHSVIA